MASSSPIPTHDERDESDLDLVYVGTENDVIMIEGAAQEVAGRGIRQGARVRARTRARNDPRSKGTRGASRQAEARDAVDDGEPGILEVAYQVAGDRIEGALYTPKQSRAQQSGRTRSRKK